MTINATTFTIRLMDETIIRPSDPFSSILANDGRLPQKKNKTDNVWEVQFDSGEIGGLSLYSTLGLQALGTRITPIFSNPSENVIKISQFNVEPIIEDILPNYFRLKMNPFNNIMTRIECFIQDSDSIVGKVTIRNDNTEDFSGFLSYLVTLKHFPGGNQMKGNQQNLNFYLSGKTNDNEVIFYMDGNSQPGKFGQSSIERSFILRPGETQYFHWFFVFNTESTDILQRINDYQDMNFDKEIAKIILLNQTNIFSINSGNPAWDKTFKASQLSASQLLIHDPETNKINLVQNRFPEKSIFSMDETTTGLSEGISPIQLWYFLQVLPNYKTDIKQVFEEWLNLQDSNGLIPNNNNSANFQSRYHAFPVLFQIADEILFDENDASLVKLYLQKLIPYLKYWLKEVNSIGLPHWENAMQSLYEDFPIHNTWVENNDGVHTNWVDSPFLKSMLIKEYELCIAISDKFGVKDPDLDWIKAKGKILLDDLLNSWDNKQKLFHYRDIQTKKTAIKKVLLKTKGSGSHKLNISLKYAQRINIKITAKKDFTKNITLEIEGVSDVEPILETIKPRGIHWANSNGFATTANIFDRISQVRIINLPEDSTIEISTSKFNLKDLSLFTPLCIQEISNEQVDFMVSRWIKQEFNSNFGLSQLPVKSTQSRVDIVNQIDLPLNTILLKSLLDRGYGAFAESVFTNLMNNLVINLQNSKKFYKLFDANNGNCTGEYNIINGMVPLTLFFNLCGIHHWSDKEIVFFGANQFSNDVIIYHRGLQVICSRENHKIITSGGKTIEVDTKDVTKVKIPT